jgi:hypothetical protein
MQRSFKIIVLFLVIAITNRTSAQISTWANSSGINSLNRGYKIFLGVNAVYVAGSAGSNIFIGKYTLNGGSIWTKTIPTNGNQTTGLTVAGGYVYICGFFSGANVNFNPQGNNILSSNGSFDAFFAKYNDADGSYKDAKGFGGTNSDIAKSIEVDGTGNIYLLGYFTSTVNFNLNGGNNSITNPGTLNTDLFLVKYAQPADNVYTLQWLNSVQTNNQGNIRGIGMDIDPVTSSVFITGTFAGNNISFDPSTGTHTLTSVFYQGTNSFDAFVASYSMLNGACLNAGNIGSQVADEGSDISYYAGNIYVTGSVVTNTSGIWNINFNMIGGTDNRSSVGGNGDIFITKYNALTFALDFAHVIGSGATAKESGYGIKATAAGIYVTGAFATTVDFDPGNQVNNLTTPNANTDIFISSFTNTGIFSGAKRIGGNNADQGFSIDANQAGDFFITGYFSGTNVDFDPGTGTKLLTAAQDDIFIAGYSSSIVLPITISSLAANKVDNAVILKWETFFESENKGFNVQRQDGDIWRTIGFVNGSGNSSATKNYSFTDIPKSGGTVLYRLEQVDPDGKTSLSNVVKVDLGKMIFSIEQFPNPAANRTTISYSLPNDETVSLQLFDNSGKLVSTIVNSKQTKGVYQFNIDVTKWSKGVYYYNFKAGKLKETKKLVVQ